MGSPGPQKKQSTSDATGMVVLAILISEGKGGQVYFLKTGSLQIGGAR
jgi:hypothetical protein